MSKQTEYNKRHLTAVMKSVFYLFFSLLILSKIASADTWNLPSVEKYCSSNRKYCLKVEPKKLDSQLAYFQDKVNGKDNAGAGKNTKDNFCKGLFSTKGKTLWKIQLDNEVAPVNAIISNNGDYVITFDNWHGVGYGNNVVAIYNGLTGTLIKRLGLSDFLTESDIYNLPASTSSIHWHGDHLIDYEKNILILKVVKPGDDEQFFDVHVDLKDGKVLDEVRDRIPSLHFLLSSKAGDEKNPPFSVKGELESCPSKQEAIKVSTIDLNKRIISKDLPNYPAAAKAVRATGESVFELVISQDGGVECINPISGHPLLRGVLINSIKKWRFEKAKTKYTGSIIIEGKDVLILNGNVIE